jgi:solute carrier family 35 protein F5
MLKTTPLVVTIGLSLTIPFAVLGDLFRGTSSGGWQALSGAGLVLASFCFMGVEGATELEDEIEHDHVALLVEEESEGEGEDEEEERLRSGSEGHRGRRGRANDGGLGVV